MPKTKKKRSLELKFNMKDASNFLLALTGENDPTVTFQTFSDSKKSEEGGYLAKQLCGQLSDLGPRLKDLNRRGAGVFVTINECAGRRSNKNISKLRALFVDNERPKFSKELTLEPSILVNSKRGPHAYWLLQDDQPLDRFTDAQASLASFLDTDPLVKDLSRVMRLPGFNHMKDPSEPFLVTLNGVNPKRYSIDEVVEAYPGKLKKHKASRPKEKDASTQPGPNDAFEKWVQELPVEEGSNNPFGGRNHTLLLLIREGLGCKVGHDRLLKIAEEYCVRSREDQSIAKEMLERQKEKHEESPFQNFFVGKGGTPLENAKAYLAHRQLIDDDGYRLRFFQDDFYIYDENRYRKIPEGEVSLDLTGFLQTMKFTKAGPNTSIVRNTLENLKALVRVDSKLHPPFYIGSQTQPQRSRLIPLKNGVFDLEHFLTHGSVCLKPHSSNFFSTVCLPYNFEEEAKCPIWVSFLKKMIPDKQVRLFLQEWFGYNLIFDSHHQKFVLLLGEGANGKTVVCVVLRALLGRENVSAVGINHFKTDRTFVLASMVGKLANVVEEMGDVGAAAEEVLKDIVSGGVMTLERKNRDPFEASISTRLTFAGNSMPRFKDRSSAIWRRMIPIHFLIQILDEREQNKNLTDASWWEKSGELAGIFNWALKGLLRLEQRGQFKVPKSSAAFNAELKRDANPAGLFLSENCQRDPLDTVSANELYRTYSDWMRERGNMPLAHQPFAAEVRRQFPDAKYSEHAKLQSDGTRSRMWLGVRLKCEGES